MLCRHTFETAVSGIPRVLLTSDAALDIAQLVKLVNTEVGWLGTARRHGRDFLIERIFLPRQQAHSTTTELTADGIADLAQDLIESQPDGVDIVNSLRFWGHSHVNMDTHPSGQDNQQMGLFADNGCEWFLRGIFNKAGKAQFDIYWFDLGLTFHDVEWMLLEEADQTARSCRWMAEIAEKVEALPLRPLRALGDYQGGGQQRLADMVGDISDDGYGDWDNAIDQALIEMGRDQPNHYGKRDDAEETALITKNGAGP